MDICPLCRRIIWPWTFEVVIFKNEEYHVQCGAIAEKLHDLEFRIKLLEAENNGE
jgi:hypothetical protein